MAISNELESFVKLYSSFDQGKKSYTRVFSDQELIQLDLNFNRFFNKLLLADGPDTKKIQSNYKKLSFIFHPDRKMFYSPEVIWLEQSLSEGKNDGACFKILDLCYEKLTNSQKFKNLYFQDIKNREDLKQWLEQLKAEANTHSRKSFYDSLLGLVNQSGSYFDEVGKIRQQGLRALLISIPILFSTYGAILFAEELFIIYALYFVVLKSGQYLENQQASDLKKIGQVFQEMTRVTATATTTLIVRIVELTFRVSHAVYDTTWQIGSSLFYPMLPSSPSAVHSQDDQFVTISLCKDLILASQNRDQGHLFKTPEMKLVAAPLEAYLGLNKQQYCQRFRLGQDKRIAIESCLFNLRLIDKSEESIEDKLSHAKKEIEKIKQDKTIFNSNMRKAVLQAEQTIQVLSENEVNHSQLVVTEKASEHFSLRKY